MKVLSMKEIEDRLASLDGWVHSPQGIQKRYELGDFLSAMNLVNRVADLAEEANHHPDIVINYDRVTFTLTPMTPAALPKKILNWQGASKPSPPSAIAIVQEGQSLHGKIFFTAESQRPERSKKIKLCALSVSPETSLFKRCNSPYIHLRFTYIHLSATEVSFFIKRRCFGCGLPAAPASRSRSPRARIPVLLWLLLLLPRLALSQSQFQDPALLRASILNSIGQIPLDSFQGYRLEGQFIYKGLGEDTAYSATYLRSETHWVVDFLHADSSRSVRYGSGDRGWVSSAEITADLPPQQLPFCAQYDFPLLFAELTRILTEGDQVRIAAEGNDVYVRGKLRSGLEATFVLNTVDYFPRKVSIDAALDPPPGWVFPGVEPNGSISLFRLPSPSSNRFEIWFSDPVDGGGYRYPRRTDYVESGGVMGSFFLTEGSTMTGSEPLLRRPVKLPWAADLSFHP